MCLHHHHRHYHNNVISLTRLQSTPYPGPPTPSILNRAHKAPYPDGHIGCLVYWTPSLLNLLGLLDLLAKIVVDIYHFRQYVYSGTPSQWNSCIPRIAVDCTFCVINVELEL